MEASVYCPPFEPPRTLHPAKGLLIGRGGLSCLGKHLTSNKEAESGRERNLELGLYSVEEGGATNNKVDLIIGLDAYSLQFEARLKPQGTFLLNDLRAEVRPRRHDIHTIIVPAKALAGAFLNKVEGDAAGAVSEAELEEAVMIGAALAVQDCGQMAEEMSELLETPNPSRRSALVLAVGKGYDWVQERRLHGKSIEEEA